MATLHLADLGADVIVIRRVREEEPADHSKSLNRMLARNKRALGLDLSRAEGRDLFLRLAKDADVVVEGFRPGVVDRLGIGYTAVVEVNPRIVYCSISGYGQDGPYRDRVGHDVNYLGFAGVIGTTGTAGGMPAIPGVQIADIGGGSLMAAVGILTALLGRAHTGRGQYVDISMMDGAVAWQVINVFNHLVRGDEPMRGDTMLTGHHPCYAVYETKDGRHVTVGALEPHFWRRLCQELGMPEAGEQQFCEGAEREALFARVRAKFRERTMAEWVERLADLDICFGPVATVSEMLRDPQVRHRRMVVEVDDGRGGTRRTLGNPIKLSDTPPDFRTPPPTMGEHTADVLHGLGYRDDDIAALRERGVV